MTPKAQIRTRMYVVLTLFSIVPVVVAAKIGWVTIADRSELRAQAKEQARSTVNIPAMRGQILDRKGRTLAVNKARYELALDPTVEGFRARADPFYEELASLTGIPASRFRARVRQRRSPQYVELHEELTSRQEERVRALNVPGLIFTPRFARQYIHDGTLAHVLGHVGTDNAGMAGLELEYDEELSGTPGRRVVRRDRSGRIQAFVGGKVTPPTHGENLVLTIDLARQAALADELQRGVRQSSATWGTAVAMDPETGGILALANVPTYDPNRPGAASESDRRNRAITDRFEPGSTFKLVGAAAAIDQGVISMDDSVETGEGWAVFHGNTIKDITAHGTIPFKDVIAQSSNVGMAKVVQRLGAGTFYQYARNMGFGHRTWIDLPGEAESVLKRPDRWSLTTQTAMAIGYEVAVTPLQLVSAYNALANGGRLMEPYVVAERRDMTGKTVWRNDPDSIRRVFSQETAHKLRPAFERAVEQGTATGARINGLRVAGKTGTALRVADGDYSKDRSRASFVGFFPADDPEVTLLVMVGGGAASSHGGDVSAPIFRRVARRWAGTFPEVVDRLTPPIQSNQNSARSLRSVRSSPLPDTSGTVPELTGLSMRRALRWLHRRGVDVRLDGRGSVMDQRPPSGAPLADRVLLDGTS